MSILASLVRAYERLPDKPEFGYARQAIHFCIILDINGDAVGDPASWGFDHRGKPIARYLNVPYLGGRSGTEAPPFFLWDNSAYVLGISSKDGYDARKRFEEFRKYHIGALLNSDDDGLQSLRRFIEKWDPDNFKNSGFSEAIIDRNIVFRFREEKSFLHERPAAAKLWETIRAPDTVGAGVCLITGERSEIARLHPPIGSFENPARIVSFDKSNDAFSSYGHVQAENAPTGIEAAFAYTAALNRFLERDSGHRIQIGDASTVFWADAADREVAALAEGSFFAMFADTSEAAADAEATRKVAILLERLRKGEQLDEVDAHLAAGVRFHVLGLAPNAARISIRFSFENDFGVLARNYQRYVADLRFEPRPKDRVITINSLVVRTAPARRDRSNRITFDTGRLSDLLAGELFRAILTGDRFPRALLAQLLMRVRSDHLLDSQRISMIKAVIVRAMRLEGRLPHSQFGQPQEDYLVRSDPDDPNPARRLGRLFALIERAQLAALGDEINTTVKDKYLGSCATAPAQVFSKLLQNAEQHHLKRLRNGHSDANWIKDSAHARRAGASLSRDIGRLAATFDNSFPAQHSDEEQGFFLIGYYQERFGGRKTIDDGGDPADIEETNEGEEQV